MLKQMLLPVLALGLVACQSGRGPLYSGPIIDPQGVDMGRYQADLTECQAIADQVPVGERAVAGAAVGAAVGGAVGGIMGNRRTAVRSAGVGAVGGGVQGVSSGMRERDQVIHNCLRGRGYRVLN